jgi:hypothetical protein
MVLAAFLLCGLKARTDLLFADGLRYIKQAEQLHDGEWRQGLLGAVDHPIYPLAIAGVHAIRGGEGPFAWQAAGQIASIVAGVLLVIPLYLVALELFGAGAAFLAVVLFYAAPLTGHILADVLSEGTFLFFWTWSLWAVLRFLRAGHSGWLPPAIILSTLAYFTRPEGILLPAALAITLLLLPLSRSTHLNWPRWWAAVAVVIIGPALLVGPYIALEGGIGTKPAIARLIGLAPRSPNDAVERSRPIVADESELMTHLRSGKQVLGAVREIASPVLFPLGVLGLIHATRKKAMGGRSAILVWLIFASTLAALLRLHVTGGYCSPRHAIVLGALLTAAAAYFVLDMFEYVRIPGRWLHLAEGRYTPGPAVLLLLVGLFVAWSAPQIATPLNSEMVGYRQAAQWLEAHTQADTTVADATGWALFYGQRTGYTFATLHEAIADPSLRWVVAREAHLRGPWWYCKLMRAMVGLREPVATFPPNPSEDQARVFIFDRTQPEVAAVSWRNQNRTATY